MANNYSVTIHIAGAGTKLKNGGESAFGHMWYELDRGDGSKPASYGFAPKEEYHGNPFAPGKVYKDDSNNYDPNHYTKRIEITKDQFDAMQGFANLADEKCFDFYKGLNNSCVDFTWRALEAAGLNPRKFNGYIIPTGNKADVDKIGNPNNPPGTPNPQYNGEIPPGDSRYNPNYDSNPGPLNGPNPSLATAPGGDGDAVPGGPSPDPAPAPSPSPSPEPGDPMPRPDPDGPSDDSWRYGDEGAVPPRRDPLVLDLDGDGIETTSPRTGTVILFDHNADGIKTGTGWVRPDDAWLVLDRDGNGTIDSGRELFGVDTLKANGQLAADGFDALREFDTNGNGQVEATDSAFASLALWRDLNQDGISQAHELSSLTGNGIASIGIDANGSAQALTDGNLISAMGQFTRTNGTVGTTGEVNGAINNAVANLDLLQNTFYSQYTTAVPLTSQAQGLPSMRGSGRVRRLNEAISLSGSLGDLVGTYVQQTTRQAQVGMLDGFITQWAATSDMQTLKDQAAALAGSGVTLAYSIEGMHWVEAVNAANDHLFVKVA